MKAFRRLLKYARPHLAWALASVAGMIGVAIASVFMVFLLSPLLDEVLSGRGGAVAPTAGAPAAVGKLSAPKVPEVGIVKEMRAWFEQGKTALRRHLPSDAVAILLLGFLAVLVKNLFLYLGHYSLFRAGLATVKDLRDRLMDSLIAQSAGYYQRQPSAVLMSRVTNDVEQINNAISDRLADLLQDFFAVIGFLVLVFSLNFRLALATFLLAPVLLGPIVHFTRKLRHRSHQSQERLGDMNAVVDEVLKGYRVVQAFGMQAFESARFREATRRHFRANLKARKIYALTAPVVEVLGAGGVLVLMWYAKQLIDSGVMTLGTLIAFLVGLYSLYNPIKRLNKTNMAIQAAIAATERVFKVIDEPVEIKDRPGARRLPGVHEGIRFEGVSFAYETEKPVLRGFDLDLPAGRAVALVGPSGAGKSTVAQLLPRFWDVQGGRVAIDGVDIRDIELRSLRGNLGLVTQETVLFNTTVRANIAYGQDRVDEERLHACARAAFAEEFILEFPNGFDTMIGEAGVRLSGGQRQRLAVARALYKDPPILILDEATSALDAEAEGIVQRALENLMQGRTTLVIAHRLATVRNADIIAVMEEGRVVEQGTHVELLARGGVYARLANMQGITE
ncbi:MAG TPA: ABC transporter transmembrane domain-containing protein [Thermoanaerobaculaceae bacterium]|nr:ABC transporter transmembrane domain-containing protein [Thermoanaerobaculaceae bacterium]